MASAGAEGHVWLRLLPVIHVGSDLRAELEDLKLGLDPLHSASNQSVRIYRRCPAVGCSPKDNARRGDRERPVRGRGRPGRRCRRAASVGARCPGPGGGRGRSGRDGVHGRRPAGRRGARARRRRAANRRRAGGARVPRRRHGGVGARHVPAPLRRGAGAGAGRRRRHRRLRRPPLAERRAAARRRALRDLRRRRATSGRWPTARRSSLAGRTWPASSSTRLRT